MEKSSQSPAAVNILKTIVSPIVGYFRNNMGIIIGLLIMCIIITVANPVFATQANLLNIMRQITTNLYLALAMTLIIILAGIDLSVGSNIALSGVVTAASIAILGMPLPVAVLMGLLMGVLIGAINGYFAATTAIPPFIITLAMMNVARGFAFIITEGAPVRIMDEAFNFIGSGFIGDIPIPVIYLLIFIIIYYFIMNKTRLGRHIYAVGGNPEAARFSGINVKRVKLFAYTASGFMGGFAGVVLASRMFSGQPLAGTGAELDAIAAVVLGGTSMSGGIGRIGGTVIGALIIGVLNNGLNLMGVSTFWQDVVKGIVILAAVYADVAKRKRADLSTSKKKADA